MKKILYSKFDKSVISTLPLAVFPGRIIVITSVTAAKKAVAQLLKSDLLGVDTETRPMFKRGASNRVALLQVSTREVCFLFRLNIIGMCAPVVQLLENVEVPMVGLSWHDDLRALQRRKAFKAGRFIDIQTLVGELGVEDLSLQKLWANFFGERLSKRSRLSNWEAETLNDQQKKYAALDAWACIQLYEEILRLRATGNYTLITSITESENSDEQL